MLILLLKNQHIMFSYGAKLNFSSSFQLIERKPNIAQNDKSTTSTCTNQCDTSDLFFSQKCFPPQIFPKACAPKLVKLPTFCLLMYTFLVFVAPHFGSGSKCFGTPIPNHRLKISTKISDDQTNVQGVMANLLKSPALYKAF